MLTYADLPLIATATFYKGFFLARCFLEEEEAEQYSREVKQRSKAE